MRVETAKEMSYLNPMNHLILGGGGFIGLRLANQLAASDDKIVIVDRQDAHFKSSDISEKNKLIFHKANLAQDDCLDRLLSEMPDNSSNWKIWSLAANSDIKKGSEDPSIDYKDTLGTTLSALKISKEIKTEQLIFASSSAVFGNQPNIRYKEDHAELHPVSNYGIMKLASEQVLKRNFESTSMKTTIFRFPNVIGWPSTHGVIHDFVKKLQKDPNKLQVLGNGFQTKPYIHVDDLVSIMIKINSLAAPFDIFNVGPSDSGIPVREIAEQVTRQIAPNATIVYEDSEIGWIGDVPKYSFDTRKIQGLTKGLKLSSKHALEKTLLEL